jgi:hypothetical protein
MDNKRVFSPVKNGKGLSPEDYMVEYPELNRAEETKNLRGVELMWCWYYGSPESPFILKEYSEQDKAIACTELVFDNIYKGRPYDEKTLIDMRKGNVPTFFGQAIEFFRKKNLEARSTGKSMIDKIFQSYNDIIEKGAEQFKTKEGDIDYAKFTSTMRMIRNEIPELIKEVEEGFGVTDKHINMDDDEREGDYWNKTYLKTK